MKTIWKVLLGITFLGLIGIGVGGWWFVNNVYDFPIQSGKLEARLKEAREVGVPVEIKDLKHDWKIPANQNAATGLAKAEKMLEAVPNRAQQIQSIRDAVSKADYTTAGRSLRAFDATLDEAKRALRAPKFRSPTIRLDYPYLTLFPHFVAYKDIARLWSLRAVVRMSAGQSEAALSDIQACHRLVALLNQEPVLITNLISIAMQSMTHRACAMMLDMQHGRRRPTSGLAAALGRNFTMPAWENSIHGEAAMTIQTVRNLDLMGGIEALTPSTASVPASPAGAARTDTLPSDAETRAYLARAVEFWIEAYRKYPGGKGNPLEVGAYLDQRSNEAKKSSQRSMRIISEGPPIFADAAGAGVQSKANFVMLRAYGTVLDYRRGTGRWPKTLAEAGVKAVDPFDGKPVRYEVRSSGFRMWCLGPNLVDDGGTTIPEAGDIKFADTVMMYPDARRGL